MRQIEDVFIEALDQSLGYECRERGKKFSTRTRIRTPRDWWITNIKVRSGVSRRGCRFAELWTLKADAIQNRKNIDNRTFDD
jgi:hypothetical protein